MKGAKSFYTSVLAVVLLFTAYLNLVNSDGDKECESEPNYIYPNPNNCTMFYKCWGGKLYPIPCPDDLAFNTELLVCDWKWNVSTCDKEASKCNTWHDVI